MTTILRRTFKTRGPSGYVCANAELTKIEGNAQAHFSITTDSGCAHEDIFEAFQDTPVAKDVEFLIWMHLCNEDGAPSYAISNAAYWLMTEEGDMQRRVVMKHLRINEHEFAGIKRAYEQGLKKQSEAQILDQVKREIAEEAVGKFIEQANMPVRWAHNAAKAKHILSQPDYVGNLTVEKEDPDDKDTRWVEVDGDRYPVESADGRDIKTIVCGPSHAFVVFKNSKEAGEAAKEHYREMARSDPDELRALLGDETLVQWALGHAAGCSGASSFEEWLDVCADHPEELWATYDGIEQDGKIPVELARELFNDSDEDPEDDDPLGTVEVVLYRT